MTVNPRMRNVQIALMLTACYLLGMVAAYYTTEALSSRRASDRGLPQSSQVAEAGYDQ